MNADLFYDTYIYRYKINKVDRTKSENRTCSSVVFVSLFRDSMPAINMIWNIKYKREFSMSLKYEGRLPWMHSVLLGHVPFVSLSLLSSVLLIVYYSLIFSFFCLLCYYVSLPLFSIIILSRLIYICLLFIFNFSTLFSVCLFSYSIWIFISFSSKLSFFFLLNSLLSLFISGTIKRSERWLFPIGSG